jgi:peptidyl-prolyl cis-trans isomerase D
MLELFRRGAKSLVVKVLLGLLVASFAVWGIGDITTGFSTKVATVGEREIDANMFATIVQREQRRLNLDPSQIRSSGLDSYVLSQMVREAAVEEAARRLGLSAPDSAVAQQVRSDPNFQIGGQFDATQYSQAVRRIFPSIAAYEETVRRSIATQQIILGSLGGLRPPAGAAQTIAAFREERRRFEAIVLTSPSSQPPEPTEADLEAHLAANPVAFGEPERRQVTWLHIDPAALAGSIEIPEAEVRAAYEAQMALLARPETRTIDQIVFATAADAQAARARLEGGLTFDALLAERRLSRADVTLGAVSKADLRGERGEAAFALAAPGIAGPVPAAGGFALLDVREIVPGFTVPFEAVAEVLRLDLARQRAEPDADRLAEQVEDARAGGATLAEAAREAGLTVQSDAGIAQDGRGAAGPLEGLAADPAFLSEVFAARPGEERRMLAAPGGGHFVVQVEAITPPRVPPLAEVRDAVAAGWRAEAARRALRTEAEALKQRLDGGETLAAIAAERAATVTEVGPLRRQDPDPRLDTAARTVLFAAKPGTAALSGTGAGVAIVVLRDVLPADPAGDTLIGLEQALVQSLASDVFDYLGRALEAEAGVSVNRSVLDSVLSQIGG